VRQELSEEQQEVLSPPRGMLASTVPAVPAGMHVTGGVSSSGFGPPETVAGTQ
jgi:hypothetical protein